MSFKPTSWWTRFTTHGEESRDAFSQACAQETCDSISGTKISRDEIESETTRFLANGGKIVKCPPYRGRNTKELQSFRKYLNALYPTGHTCVMQGCSRPAPVRDIHRVSLASLHQQLPETAWRKVADKEVWFCIEHYEEHVAPVIDAQQGNTVSRILSDIWEDEQKQAEDPARSIGIDPRLRTPDGRIVGYPSRDDD